MCYYTFHENYQYFLLVCLPIPQSVILARLVCLLHGRQLGGKEKKKKQHTHRVIAAPTEEN